MKFAARTAWNSVRHDRRERHHLASGCLGQGVAQCIDRLVLLGAAQRHALHLLGELVHRSP